MRQSVSDSFPSILRHNMSQQATIIAFEGGSMQPTCKKPDYLIQQFLFLTPWIWGKQPEMDHTIQALARLAEDETDVEALGCLAAMSLEEPVLHLEILHRIHRLSPQDEKVLARIRYYESTPVAA
jgi:hypothetical protein